MLYPSIVILGCLITYKINRFYMHCVEKMLFFTLPLRDRISIISTSNSRILEYDFTVIFSMEYLYNLGTGSNGIDKFTGTKKCRDFDLLHNSHTFTCAIASVSSKYILWVVLDPYFSVRYNPVNLTWLEKILFLK